MRKLLVKYHDQRQNEELNMQNQMDTVRKNAETQIQKILTEEQAETYWSVRYEGYQIMHGNHSSEGCGGCEKPCAADR